jgi:hypothetical protein
MDAHTMDPYREAEALAERYADLVNRNDGVPTPAAERLHEELRGLTLDMNALLRGSLINDGVPIPIDEWNTHERYLRTLD